MIFRRYLWEQVVIMSLHEGFGSTIKQQPELFSVEDREDLLEQSPTWSEDSDELDGDVYQWLQTRPNIYKAALKNISSKESDRKEPSSTKPSNPKVNLLNVINRSFSD